MIKKILFFGILLLAIVLRFAFLSIVPPSASLDEATIGWNAYSILHTGRDEYGYFLPLLLRAYDDYRPALYVYLVVPFIKIFGLQVFSVRLPSVLLSLATVVMSFFLVKNFLTPFKKKETVALITMLLLAVSPWSVYVSRLGHEVNLGLCAVVASLLLFFIALNKKNGWVLIAALIFFGISFYSYQSEKIFTPLILLCLLIIFWKQLLLFRKQFALGLVVFVLVSLPMFFASLTPGALLRLKGTSIFNDNPRYVTSARKILAAKQKGDMVEELLNNRRVITGEIFAQNYLSHFSFIWLFGNTGNEPFKAPNTGLMYIWEAPFLLLGLLYLFLSKEISGKIKLVVVAWVLADFVAPGLTTQAPHALRAYTLLPLPQILTAVGIVLTTSFLQKQSKGISIGFVVLLGIIALQSLSQFITNYFIVFPYNQSQSFQYALQNTFGFVAKNQKNYTRVVISNSNNLYQSYMFYLFYTKYDPKKYLSENPTKSGGFAETHTIGAIAFRPIQWDKEAKGSLLVGNPTELPTSSTHLFTSYNLDGSIGVVADVKE